MDVYHAPFIFLGNMQGCEQYERRRSWERCNGKMFGQWVFTRFL